MRKNKNNLIEQLAINNTETVFRNVYHTITQHTQKQQILFTSKYIGIYLQYAHK